VIGIIAILIGILLPVLSRVRQSGNSIKCQANLRQLTQGILGYAAENKGSLPWGFYWRRTNVNGSSARRLGLRTGAR